MRKPVDPQIGGTLLVIALLGIIIVLLTLWVITSSYHTGIGKLTATNCSGGFASSVVVFSNNGTDRALTTSKDTCTALSTHLGQTFRYTYNDNQQLHDYQVV